MTHQPLSDSRIRPGGPAVALKVGGRAGLVVLATAASLGLLGSLLGGAMATTFVDEPNLYTSASVVSDRKPATVLPDGDLSFGVVDVLVPAQYDVQLLDALGVGLPYLVFAAICILVLLLLRRLWTGRSFTRLAACGLAIVGVLTIASGALSQWLSRFAREIALGRLGLPQSFDAGMEVSGTGEWFSAHVAGESLLDYPGIGLGLALLLLAVLVHRGRSLQESVDGLV